MAERRDPKPVRASLVDSGWSEPPPPASNAPVKPSRPPPPSSRPPPAWPAPVAWPAPPASAAPRAAPPSSPTASRSLAAPLPAPARAPEPVIAPAPAPRQTAAPSEPPPAPVRVPASVQSRELSRYAESVAQVESTHVDRSVEARARAMLSQATIITELPSAQAAFIEPPLDDSHDEDGPGSRVILPGFGAAMAVRVRLWGGAVPLWSIVVPLVMLASLAAAFAAAAASHAPAVQEAEDAAPSAHASASSLSAAASLPLPPAPRQAAPVASAIATGSEPAGTPAVEAFDLAPGTYLASDVLSLAQKRSQREANSAHALEAALDRDPGSVQEPRTLAEIRRLTDAAETAPIVLGAIAKLPAPIAADLLYEIWTGTVQRNDTTELARALLFSKDVRPKASAALSVALDLRAADSCEKSQGILPRAQKDADRRSLHLLIRLQRRYGCGPNKRLDCYPCLRKDDAVDAAIKIAKDRPEPRAFGKR